MIIVDWKEFSIIIHDFQKKWNGCIISQDLVLIWVPSRSHDQTRSSDSPEYSGPTPCSHLPSPQAPWINNQPDLWWYQIFRGMYSLTSRCFCSCLSCLPYSERARVRCLGLHSRNPAVEHFQERQWIQPPWNIALEIKFGLTIYNIHINIYSILYMAQFFFLKKNHPPDIPHHLIPLAVQCCLTPGLFVEHI